MSSVGRVIVSVVKLDLPGWWDYNAILSVLRSASDVLSNHSPNIYATRKVKCVTQGISLLSLLRRRKEVPRMVEIAF
jgi:hypothetical protein